MPAVSGKDIETRWKSDGELVLENYVGVSPKPLFGNVESSEDLFESVLVFSGMCSRLQGFSLEQETLKMARVSLPKECYGVLSRIEGK